VKQAVADSLSFSMGSQFPEP